MAKSEFIYDSQYKALIYHSRKLVLIDAPTGNAHFQKREKWIRIKWSILLLR